MQDSPNPVGYIDNLHPMPTPSSTPQLLPTDSPSLSFSSAEIPSSLPPPSYHQNKLCSDCLQPLSSDDSQALAVICDDTSPATLPPSIVAQSIDNSNEGLFICANCVGQRRRSRVDIGGGVDESMAAHRSGDETEGIQALRQQSGRQHEEGRGSYHMEEQATSRSIALVEPQEAASMSSETATDLRSHRHPTSLMASTILVHPFSLNQPMDISPSSYPASPMDTDPPTAAQPDMFPVPSLLSSSLPSAIPTAILPDNSVPSSAPRVVQPRPLARPLVDQSHNSPQDPTTSLSYLPPRTPRILSFAPPPTPRAARHVGCIYPGSKFVGTQKSGRNSYKVEVTIQVRVLFTSILAILELTYETSL